jgi:hypothetical protein
MMGPGKYDDECTWVRERTHAEGVLLIVIHGNRGEGFAAQASPEVLVQLPELLEHVAKQIRKDREALGN